MYWRDYVDSRDLEQYEGKKVELISQESRYCETEYRRIFKLKYEEESQSIRCFDCDKNGWVDRDNLSSEQRERFDSIIVRVALNQAIELGIESRKVYQTTPAIGHCIKCGVYVEVGKTLQCRGCDLVYDHNGFFDRQITEYFRLSQHRERSLIDELE